MSIKSVMPSNHLILCNPLLLLPSIFPKITVFSDESAFSITWSKYWSFSFNISPFNEHPVEDVTGDGSKVRCCKEQYYISSVQFSTVAQSCPTLCDPMNCSTPGLPVHHQLPEFTQSCIHQVSDAIQPSYPWLSPSPPAPNPSQHQSLFQ